MLSDGSNASTTPVNPQRLNSSALMPVPAPTSINLPSLGIMIPVNFNQGLKITDYLLN